MKNKKIIRVNRGTAIHWVGDGFPVYTLFSYHHLAEEISPFLLLDYAAPAEFTPTTQKRGVGFHPHRGFETVTIVYQGEVEHKDSAGNSGKIGPGDVQWMTAGSGILHEEMHGQDFRRTGGTMEMVQLWVNLPAKDKMTKPGYQGILNKDIPVIKLPENGGEIRVIAGHYGKLKGAAKTFTPVNLWDIWLQAGRQISLTIPAGYNTALLLLKGKVTVNDAEGLSPKELALFEQSGDQITLKASIDAKLLLVNGAPLNEPVVGYGPFVMNTQTEIRQAMADFQAGRFGIPPE